MQHKVLYTHKYTFMERRNFLKNSSLALIGASLFKSAEAGNGTANEAMRAAGSAKNIIFMVSDGMSNGTLTMADLLLQRKEGRNSHWMRLYNDNSVRRALMDTASASSMVTDSAAASSAWGGGVRVKNGSLNVNADGSFNKPILQKFKAAGKAVGCVTSVPIAHATPAGFCVNNNKRGDMEEIASDYLKLQFDVMMGGGTELFMADKRKDKRNLFKEFSDGGFTVVQTRKEMMGIGKGCNKPVLGVFNPTSIPFALDRENDKELIERTPTLAEMSKTAIDLLSKNKNGFVMQIEGGKVDWAAHANDAGGLIYDQIAFDEAIKVAIDFAKTNKDTLVIITTDHGNANPGLFYGSNADKNFDQVMKFKNTNEWVLIGINRNFSTKQVIERLEAAQGYAITNDEAKEVLSHYEKLDETGVYNSYKLPFKTLADIQRKYTSVGWGSTDHSGDYVELAMYGAGSTMLKPFIKNYELHHFMLKVAGITV